MKKILLGGLLVLALAPGVAWGVHSVTEQHVVDLPAMTTVIDPPPITVVQDPPAYTFQDADEVVHETVTVTVTEPASTEPPPPALPDVDADENWTCNGPVDLDWVRVTPEDGTVDAVSLRAGCYGRIGKLEVEGRFIDCIKANPPDGGPRNLVIESGFCRATAPPANLSAHQDCIQAGGGEDVLFQNFVFDCIHGGGGNYFIAGFNDGTPHLFLCDHCAFGPRHPNQIRTPSDPDSGVMNSLVCQSESGRAVYLPASGDKGGNFSPAANDPACSFEGLLAYANS